MEDPQKNCRSRGSRSTPGHRPPNSGRRPPRTIRRKHRQRHLVPPAPSQVAGRAFWRCGLRVAPPGGGPPGGQGRDRARRASLGAAGMPVVEPATRACWEPPEPKIIEILKILKIQNFEISFGWFSRHPGSIRPAPRASPRRPCHRDIDAHRDIESIWICKNSSKCSYFA